MEEIINIRKSHEVLRKECAMKKSIAQCVNDALLNILASDFDPERYKSSINQDAVKFLEDYIDWYRVSQTVDMSPEFIEANIDKIDIGSLPKNPHLREEFVLKHLDDYRFREELVRMFFRGSISSYFVCEHGTEEQFRECLRLLEKKDEYPWLRKW